MSTAADCVGGRGVRSLYGPKGWSLRLPRLASAVLCPTAGNFDAHTGLLARCWQILPDVGSHKHPHTCERCNDALG